ncbi:MAG TPA: hypothetical protein VMT37_14435 [Solirubrobacterales bacterium]|nr:hypothetical protein [Solirubrobacterales bacterium]
MKRLVPRLSYANVMATIAVFIALGGAGYAAIGLPKNSVGARQVRAGAITSAKIRRGAVTGSKVNVASLGQVPSAAQAGLATNANQLAGKPAGYYSDGCPAGTSRVAKAICATGSRGATTYVQAIQECSEAGLRVPSPAEASIFGPGLPADQPFWVDDFWVNGAKSEALIYWPEHSGLYGVESSLSYWIYCVTTPTDG